MAKGRMHHHARRLVDHGQVVVEVHHVEVYGLGLEHKFARRLRQHQRNLFTWLHAVVRLHRNAVHPNRPGFGRLLDAVPRGFLEEIEQKLVYAQRFLARVGDKPVVHKKFLFACAALLELVVKINHCFTNRVGWPASLRST